MKRNWIKFSFERNTYVVDLSCISTFVCAKNGRLMFCLPDGKVPIVIHPKTNPEAYQQILDYIENTTRQSRTRDLNTGLVKSAGESVIKSDGSG
jgi:hypothetical protein